MHWLKGSRIAYAASEQLRTAATFGSSVRQPKLTWRHAKPISPSHTVLWTKFVSKIQHSWVWQDKHEAANHCTQHYVCDNIHLWQYILLRHRTSIRLTDPWSWELNEHPGVTWFLLLQWCYCHPHVLYNGNSSSKHVTSCSYVGLVVILDKVL